jgi:hypothetical protein
VLVTRGAQERICDAEVYEDRTDGERVGAFCPGASVVTAPPVLGIFETVPQAEYVE